MTLNVVWANRAAGTLASSLTTGALTLTRTSGQGALFPSPTSPQIFPLVLSQAASPNTYEIVYCTARSTDTLTIERAQEGTTATSFSAGDNVSLEPTAGTLPVSPAAAALGFPTSYAGVSVSGPIAATSVGAYITVS